MVCIVTALGFEAQPLIEHYGLTSLPDSHFRIYEGEGIRLIISGVGKLRSSIATTYLLSKVEDIARTAAINIGLCGSHNRDYAIGMPILMNKIRDADTGYEYFPDILFRHDMVEGELNTHRRIVSLDGHTDIGEEGVRGFVDMEAAGFYEAASTFLPPHRIACMKIISDHLDNRRLSRADVALLIEGAMSEVDMLYREKLKDIGKMVDVLDEADIEYLEDIVGHLRLTMTQRHELFDMAFKYKLRTGNPLPIFHYKSTHTISKREGKKRFEGIREIFWGQ